MGQREVAAAVATVAVVGSGKVPAASCWNSGPSLHVLA